ncbi:MAG: DHHA1 domain-containing protein [Methanomassiliicoccales archaeon]
MSIDMTRLLYEVDPYLKTFDAIVTTVRGEWLSLDRTAFFPGGGGQDADTGWLAGLEVKSVKMEGGEVFHHVPGHALRPGARVDCQIDWERRLDLMRGHTGEHLLYSILSKIHPEIELVKISITPSKKSLIVKGDLSWPLLSMAQSEANEAIASQLPVSEVWTSKDSDLLKQVRIKADKIHGDRVRIVKIGEIDKAACAGIHVQNTREIKMIVITRLVSARPMGDYEIQFEVGRKAIDTALRLSSLALQASEAAGSRPDDLINAIANLKNDVSVKSALLKTYAKAALANLMPEKIEGARVYSGVFEGLDKKTLIDTVNKITNEERTAAILAALDDKLMLIVATSNDLEVDSRKILAEALEPLGGKGGGKMHFASGGASDPSKGTIAVRMAKEALKKALSEGDGNSHD